MSNDALKSILVIALRQILPAVGGAAYATDENIGHIVATICIIVSVWYHARQRHVGKQANQ